MNCDKCKDDIEMKMGIAIHTDKDDRNVCHGFGSPYERHPLKFVYCWKCPNCGRSIDLNDTR